MKYFRMTKYRIKTEFAIEILDEEAAQAVARQHLIAQLDKTVMEGGRVDTGNDIAADRIETLIKNPLVLSSTLVSEMIGRGAQHIPMVTIEDLLIEHIDD